MTNATYPPFLQSGDLMIIISASGVIDKKLITDAKLVFEQWGYEVEIAPNADARYGRFAGTEEQRISDLQNVLDHPKAKAIFCSRGGYGLTQIIDKINFKSFISNPKWLIGFSDITVLHNAISAKNIVSCHGSMAKYITESKTDDSHLKEFKNFLCGKINNFEQKSHPQNRLGKAKGIIRGGNLSVLYGLRATPFDIDFKNTLLFIEDIGEQPYHIDRMMQNLRLSGALSQVNGLLVGQFNQTANDPEMMATIPEIIRNACNDYNFPIIFDLPFGHIKQNMPLLIGAQAEINVTLANATLNYTDLHKS